jgi:D-alanyl-D-alanine carboxypeptidase
VGQMPGWADDGRARFLLPLGRSWEALSMRRWSSLLVAVILLFTVSLPETVHANPAYSFPQTGYSIDDPRFQDFFDTRGGLNTFGYPVSRGFTFRGFPVQVFQRAVMQQFPTGQVQLLNLLDTDLFPYTEVNGAQIPSVDPTLTTAAPSVDGPGYAEQVLNWIGQISPDRWNGLPVAFHQHFLDTVSARDAFPAGPGATGLLVGFDLEIWGVPTSRPTYDPHNRAFVYQRFQRGVMHFDTSCSCTRGLLLADYFKGVLLGENLPSDLLTAARSSPYFGQYNPAKPHSVDRPGQLPDSGLTNAFEPDVIAATGIAPVRIRSDPPPNVSATSIAVIDEGSGALLYARDPHHHLAPASLTKIFTALTALKYGQLSRTITVQFDPAQLTDSTLMGIHPGETYTLEDLLYGLMLPSGNDAALAIANGLGGSESAFVGLMNAEVGELGLADSHFMNPHGLDAPGHYSSAYDLAMAARYGMTHYPQFRQLADAQSWVVQGSRTFSIHNLNRFLWSYPGADGVKIGYTDNAGKTIVASATRNGHRVYVALLNCGDIVADSVPLMNWVFDNYAWPS